MINLIAILSRQTRAIGKDGGLLWDNLRDLAHFKELTKGHPVIMGRKTWESLPEKWRPLPGRANIVVSRDPGYIAEGALVADSIEKAISAAKSAEGGDEVWVIGGGVVYALAMPLADRLYLTLVDDDSEGDTHFPDFKGFEVTEESEPEVDKDGNRFQFVTYERSSSTS